MDAERLLAGLDERQRHAVTTPAMPLAVLAPAGSGKTRVLTRRIAHRIATGTVEPSHVLAVTFTRKAAAELRTRLHDVGLRDQLAAGTFHALALAMLRDHARDRRHRPPVILDRKAPLLRELADGNSTMRVLGEVANEIGWAKANQVPPAHYVDKARAARRRVAYGLEKTAELYRRYEVTKHDRGLLDFDDLLREATRALEHDQPFADAERWRFRHLFVDEFQDVNSLQFRLLEAWRGDRSDLFVVGDPQQAIYGWNGADPSFLLDIACHYPPIEIIELDQNYRSSAPILAAATSVLRTAGQPTRDVTADQPGELPMLDRHDDDRAEAAAIAVALRRTHGPRTPWREHAVLTRTHAELLVIREACQDAQVPVVVKGNDSLVDDPTIRPLLRKLDDDHRPLAAVLDDLESVADPDVEDGDPVLALIERARDHLASDPRATAREFSAAVRADAHRGDGAAAPDAVTLATFHAAKGLEWSVVHLAGLEDGFVPIGHARTPAAKAEEARLLYVAMTRARDDLRLHWAARRLVGGRPTDRERSPLLAQLDLTPAAVEPLSAVESHLDDARSRIEVAPLVEREQIHQALVRWREAMARRARTAPATILPDRALAAIADRPPADEAELGEVPGVGAIRAHRLATDLLAVIRTASTPSIVAGVPSAAGVREGVELRGTPSPSVDPAPPVDRPTA